MEGAKMKMRIVLSMVALLASCSNQDNAVQNDDEPVAAKASALEGDPCGVWVDRTQVMAQIRKEMNPLRPDVLFFTHGTTTCADATWYCDNHYPSWDGWYQGCVKGYIHAPGANADGIGTSPSLPDDHDIGTSPSEPGL